MDPVTIGTTVALLAAKSAGTQLAEKFGEGAGESGWGLASRLIGRVRAWFSSTDESAEAQLLALVEATEPSEEELASMAHLIATRLDAAPKVRDELSKLVEMTQSDPELGQLLRESSIALSSGRDSNVITQTAGNNSIVAGRDVHKQ